MNLVIGSWIMHEARRGCGTRAKNNCSSRDKLVKLAQDFRSHLLCRRQYKHAVCHAAVEMNSISIRTGVMKQDICIDVVVVVPLRWCRHKARTPEWHR